jgi:L-lactate dehydrogenase complex protein LldG
MTSSRDSIFSSIRRSLHVKGDERIRAAIVEDRLDRSPKGIIPTRAQIDHGAKVALLLKKLDGVQATYARLASHAEVPAAVAEYLRSNNLPATLRRGDDPRLDGIPWQETTLEVTAGRSDGHDLNAISHAEAAIAETGTLVMISGHENPTTLNFLPDNHIVVLSASDLVGDLEAIWPRLRKKYGKGLMPRTVNCITGASRSGDIEQTILLGAHGPRRLHVLVVEG